MILKKLRDQRNWSQEQLAVMAGLSVRTIQRIESGNKASLESLKSLASVLEVELSLLQQEIIMIDKTSENWLNAPFWLRLHFTGSHWLGLPERLVNIWAERFLVVIGIAQLLYSFYNPDCYEKGLIAFVFAYGISLFTRAGDKHKIW